ncbi:putative vegetative incompatibility protein 2 [Diaporthe ampelina]|uniref:Putative vegetative incompatibility protein 2 n=1 Tax=Diaporthe ampelina TaxID=1214573 RepID=A0A0G2HUC0_9PEZI|nr:putative vegetative incompatibility protein 2 [Diaporthe ampelina]
MLGRLGMGTQEALKAYDSFASEIFSNRRMSLTEKYKARALEETVQKLVRAQEKGSMMRNRRPGQEKGHAFVCTMPAQRHKEMVCLRTYDVEGDKYPNCLIYEAARATTAATTYFKPMTIKDEEGQEEKFVDAALGTNNPISILWDEAVNLFGKKRRLGCVVSLGTGSRKVEMAPGGEKLKEKARFLISAVKVMKEIGTDSEKDHQRWQAKFEEFESTYFRLNVDGGAQGIELSDWQKIGQLKARTRDYLQNPEPV